MHWELESIIKVFDFIVLNTITVVLPIYSIYLSPIIRQEVAHMIVDIVFIIL